MWKEKEKKSSAAIETISSLGKWHMIFHITASDSKVPFYESRREHVFLYYALVLLHNSTANKGPEVFMHVGESSRGLSVV